MESALAPLRGAGRPILQAPVRGQRRRPSSPAPLPLGRSAGLLAVIAAGAVATVGACGGSTRPTSQASETGSPGRAHHGLLAGYSVVVLVALMARLPRWRTPCRRRLARWTRWVAATPSALSLPRIADHLGLLGHRAHERHHQSWTLLRSYPTCSRAASPAPVRRRRHQFDARSRPNSPTRPVLPALLHLPGDCARLSHQFANGPVHEPTRPLASFWRRCTSRSSAAGLVPDRGPARGELPPPAPMASVVAESPGPCRLGKPAST